MTAIALMIAAVLLSVVSKLRSRRRRAAAAEAPLVQGVEPLFGAAPEEITITRVTLLRTAPDPSRAASQPSAPAAVPAPEAPAAPAAAQEAPAVEPGAAAEEGIEVDGRPLTPLQYRWLFPDLANLPESEAALARHYRTSGRDEIARKVRFAPADRLLALDLQRLSPTAPDTVPSPFWRYVPGTSGTLNIICSHIAPAGQFGPTIPQNGSPDAQLYIRPEAHEYFQRGVPGLTTTIEETARWLEAVIAHLRPTRLRVVGFSAGAYGALLFGHLLSADAITAIAGDFVLGRPQYRSHLWYEARSYHPAYRDLRPFLPAMAPRLALLYPAYDPIDFRAVQEARAAGLANMAMCADFHPAENGVKMAAILAGPETLVPIERFNPYPYPDPFDDATVEQLAAAHEALAERDYARSAGLLRGAAEKHPRNHGLFCHIGIQQGLMGDMAGGEATIRAAREALLREFPDGYGERLARFARTLVRDFYQPEPTLLRRLEALFETDPAPAG